MLHDFALDEMKVQLQLLAMQLELEVGKLLEQQGFVSDEDGQLEDSLQHFSLDEELKQHELLELLLRLELSLLLEQQGLLKDDDKELQDNNFDIELSEEQLNETLQDVSLDELLGLLQLNEMELKLEVCKLLEQQGLLSEEDGQLQDELIE